MKKKIKILIIILSFFLCASKCFAQASVVENQESYSPLTEKFKQIDFRQGISFSIVDKELKSLSTIEIIRWKALCFEAGYTEESFLIGVLSLKLIDLNDFVEIPILELIKLNIGAYYGRGHINKGTAKEEDYGFSATLIEWNF